MYKNIEKIRLLRKKYKNNENIQHKIYDEQKIIPLNVYQSWYTNDIPSAIEKIIDSLKIENPEFKCYLYTIEMCRDFIKNNFKNLLYTFDKLQSNLQKLQLWKYCILYINGGIYLDIKYTCTNNFKLVTLTNKEYFCKNNNQICDYLIVCLPYNSILLKCIEKMVDNVKNNLYSPINIICENINLCELSYNLKEKSIYFNSKCILKMYPDYNIDKLDSYNSLNQITLYNSSNLYNYLYLTPITKTILTKTIMKNINEINQEYNYITFYSGSPCIIKHPSKLKRYIINIRWINYKLNDDGTVLNIALPKGISLNSRFETDGNFNRITNEIFLEDNYAIEKNYNYLGLEDMRIFNYMNETYYTASYYDNNRKIISISANIYNLNDSEYTLNRNIITPQFNNANRIEKNWVYVNYNNSLHIIYTWYPITICELNLNKNSLEVVEYKYNIPEFFKGTKGSTCGFIFNKEIWFVLHKSQISNYQHYFAVFDLDMNLLRYSELFKLDNCRVEFCIGLIIEKNRTILSYSSLDTNCIISTYDNDYINNNIKWYNKSEFFPNI